MACPWNMGYVRGHSPCNLCTLSVAKVYKPALSFGHRYSEFRKKLYRLARLFKIIEIATNRKLVCDAQLVSYCNYVPIFYRFWDITIYWWNVCLFRRFIDPSLVWSHRNGCSLWSIPVIIFGLKTRFRGLPYRENCMILRSLVLSQYLRVTDGQTDTSPVAKSHIAIFMDARSA